MGSAHAALTTIGTAQFGKTGEEYKLIWDNDNNGNSVVWLDYSKRADWSTQKTWASELDSALTINLKYGYTVKWGTESWRLPTTVDGVWQLGYDGSTTAGYNITNSEMGHLFYKELINKGDKDTYGYVQSGSWLQHTGEFSNLFEGWYWSGTESSSNNNDAWSFTMNLGSQGLTDKDGSGYALAVRSGRVSAVPVPGAIWLFGTGLVGLVGARRKLKK